MLETSHTVYFENANNTSLEANSIDLVVTSPPYPMIEMWDDIFSETNTTCDDALEQGEGLKAFEEMHVALDKVWAECDRVLNDEGMLCINIGDATRKLDTSFQLYPNHSRISTFFREKGYRQLPSILWQKPTNKASKFMGSGMLPPNAYITLEHEYVLIFKKDKNRYRRNKEYRYESAYFWEERNKWFSDTWTDILGTRQELSDEESRERSASFPLELPFRLIQMYSVRNDVILDPFLGTGTTSVAAAISGRNSVGIEIDASFKKAIQSSFDTVEDLSVERAMVRLNQHKAFVEERRDDGKDFKYSMDEYDMPVTTKQEKEIKFRRSVELTRESQNDELSYRYEHPVIE